MLRKLNVDTSFALSLRMSRTACSTEKAIYKDAKERKICIVGEGNLYRKPAGST